jgi:DNA-binding Lrp family transcriptional regulator
MQTLGIISRFGVVVRHRAFGYIANAMAVWDIADDQVDAVAGMFAEEAGVTLCYRRPRRLPDWRYNLFTMIHGTSRPDVHAVIASRGAGGRSSARP